MRDILEPYVGKEIGANIRKPFQLDPHTLVAVTDSYFTLRHVKETTSIHVPYMNIVRILQNETEDIHVGGLFQHKQDFRLIVKIGHVVTSIPG